MKQLVIATPCYGGPSTASVSVGYALALAGLVRDPAIGIVPHVYLTNTDLTRARSRAVEYARRQECDLLFWDSDVTGTPEQIATCVRGLVQSGCDLIGVPYRRRQPDVDYAIRHDGHLTLRDGVGEVTGVGMGFTFISRGCMSTMVEHYRPTLAFDDVEAGEAAGEVVALFHLMLRDRRLLSEDYSFAQRWRDIGGKCHIFCGDGAPLNHIGSSVFEGDKSTLFRK